MIHRNTWRQQLRLHTTLALLGLFLLAACAQNSPVAPGDTPPPDGNNPTTGMVTLSWDAPTANADGSTPLTDLIGYTVCYGSSNTQLGNCQDVGNVTNVELELPIGTHYVAVRAYDNWRNESSFSNVIEVMVTVPPAS